MTFKEFYTEATEVPLTNWADLQQKSPMLKAAVGLLIAIEEVNSSAEALIVGGAVRDILLQKDPKDIDIATNMATEELTRHFKTHDVGASKDFGIHTVTWEGFQFEVAAFRTEGTSTDNRRPDSVSKVDSFEEDSKRRDITFNALGLSRDGVIIDYHNGIEDLNNKIVRTVGNAHERFKEDGLRLCRVMRFAAKMGFKIEPETKKAIIELKHLVEAMPGERVRDEMLKAATSGNSLADYFIHLNDVGLLEKILPEFKAMEGKPHTKETHPEGGVFEHVISAMRHSRSTDPITNLAIAFHDLGKAITLTFTPEGKPQYKGHEYDGLPLVDAIASRLKFSTEDKQAIKFAMEHHMLGHRIKEMSPSKLIGMRHSPHWEHLKQTFRADDASRLHLFDEKEYDSKMEHIENLYNTFGKKQEFEKKMSELINGQMIMQIVPGIKGPEIGKIKDAVRQWIVDAQFQVTQDQVIAKIKELA